MAPNFQTPSITHLVVSVTLLISFLQNVKPSTFTVRRDANWIFSDKIDKSTYFCSVFEVRWIQCPGPGHRKVLQNAILINIT